MKRWICVGLALCLFFGGAVSAPAEEPRWGDADGDGVVTTTDARLLLSEIACKCAYFPGTPEYEERMARMRYMNVDGDEAITTTDARLILQYVVKKIDRFPVEEI